MKKFRKVYSLLLLFISIFNSTILFGQWSSDPHVNNPICTTVNQQQAPRIVSDGHSGAIITWWDYDLSIGDNNIYAQRIDSAGIIQWASDGVVICTNPLHQQNPEITSDGNGGAIIAWQDNRSGRADIYAQRIDGSGVVQWSVDGIPVCSDTLDQIFPQLISDGNGGAIVTWQDLRGGTNYIPYAQKINASGISQWTAGGVLLSPNTAETPQIISDGNGGAIIAWHQYTGIYPNGNFEIIVQQINTNGILGWGSNGVIVSALTSNQLRPQLISDGSNGAIIVWEDYRNATTYSNLYAQKINLDGVAQWTLDGIAVAPNTLHQIRQKLLSDGSGGVFITWQYSNNYKVYAQRISSGGVSQWASDGVSICNTSDPRYPDIATDGGTGAIITWYDFRGSGNGDIFAQRINSEGSVQWITNGVGVCRNPSGQASPRLVADARGGTVITWEDVRNIAVSSSDIYAQRVNSDGTLGGVTDVNENVSLQPSEFSLEQNYPNPFNPSTTIKFSIPNEEFVSLKVFNSLGEEVAELLNETKPTGNYSVSFNASQLSSGVYFYKISAGNFIETKKMILMK